MVDIQSPTAEIRQGKKKKKKKNKPQDENIMVCPITWGDHNKKKETTGQMFSGLPYYIGRPYLRKIWSFTVILYDLKQ